MAIIRKGDCSNDDKPAVGYWLILVFVDYLKLLQILKPFAYTTTPMIPKRKNNPVIDL